MGWGNCGTDSKGRLIGYYHAATCDHPGCRKRIDRGLSYACGGMHGNASAGGDDRIDWSADFPGCEKYFCESHLVCPDLEHDDGTETYAPTMCLACAAEVERRWWNDEECRWPTNSPRAAQGMEARSGETEGLDPKGDGPVLKGCAHD